MFVVLSGLIFATAVVVMAWALYFVSKDRAVILKQLWAAAVVEVLLIVQAVTCAVVLLNSSRALEAWEFWGYILTIVIILPGAAAWAFAERTKWSSVVLAVAAFTVIFLQFRLIQLWG